MLQPSDEEIILKGTILLMVIHTEWEKKSLHVIEEVHYLRTVVKKN